MGDVEKRMNEIYKCISDMDYHYYAATHSTPRAPMHPLVHKNYNDARKELVNKLGLLHTALCRIKAEINREL